RPSGVLTNHRTLQAPAICRRISQPFDSRLRKFSLWTNALTIETRVMPNILPKKHTAAGIILYHLRGSQVAPITGSTNSRPISGTIKIGQTARRNGCIKSRLRLTKDFLARTIVARLVGAQRDSF